MFSAITMALGLTTTAIAQSVVVRSTGPSAASFPAGKKFAANTQISLKASDQVTVLDEAGTRVLIGPGNYTLDGRVTADRNRYANMSRTLKSSQAVRAGAVRGPGTAAVPEGETLSPTIWYIDMRKGGKTCVPAGGNLVLWRQNTDVGQSAWLAQDSGGMMQRLFWGRGTPGIVWSSAVAPLENGYSYIFRDETPAAGQPMAADVNVELAVLDTVPENPTELASVLLEQNCMTQFEYLALRMADAAAAPAES